MACEGATSNVCTGILTGEPCAAPKPITDAVTPPLGDVVMQGTDTAIFFTWDTSVSHPTHQVRGLIRPLGERYKAEGVVLSPRDNGALTFSNLDPDTMYTILLRLENDTEANTFYHGTGYPRDLGPIYLTQVRHDDDGVMHNQIAVVFTT